MSVKIWKMSLFSYFSSSAIQILLELKGSVYFKLPMAYKRDLHSLDLCLPLVLRTSFLLDANDIWCKGGHFAKWVVDCVILALSTRAECNRFPYVLSHNLCVHICGTGSSKVWSLGQMSLLPRSGNGTSKEKHEMLKLQREKPQDTLWNKNLFMYLKLFAGDEWGKHFNLPPFKNI